MSNNIDSNTPSVSDVFPPSHLDSFAAVDFESANGEASSICSIGIVFVHDNVITDHFYSLVRPEPNYYHYYNSKIHGIKKGDTINAMPFPKVWRQVEKRLDGLPLVAHNKLSDERSLKKTFQIYRMRYPGYKFYCTYQGSRIMLPELENYKLQTVAKYFGFDLTNHHNALADAEACAIIAMNIF